MRYTIHLMLKLLLMLLCWQTSAAEHTISVPILTYHKFDPSKFDSMTISTQKFEDQLKWLKTNGYTVIPMQECVNYLLGKRDSLPPKSLVISADDGHKSVYKYMLPLIRKYQVPVTLFIYPIVISHGSSGLTWEQLKEMKKTGLFDVQGHTYWHPNFKQEKRHLSAEAYQKLVHVQLFNSKAVLEKNLRSQMTLLAWPYGIYDDYLEQEAEKAGYTMAFSIDGRNANPSEKNMAQPRYMIVEGQSMKTFAAIVEGNAQGKKQRKHQ